MLFHIHPQIIKMDREMNMKLWELLAIAVALSMDAFAIASCRIMGTNMSNSM